jgi:PAS domain-containing protein
VLLNVHGHFVNAGVRALLKIPGMKPSNSVDQLLVHHEKAIEHLKKEESKYRSLFEEAPVGMFQMSFSGRLLSVNRMMARIYGYDSPEQLLAETVDTRQQFLVEPSQAEGVEEFGRGVQRPGPHRG